MKGYEALVNTFHIALVLQNSRGMQKCKTVQGERRGTYTENVSVLHFVCY